VEIMLRCHLLYGMVLLYFVQLVVGHGVITTPATRNNPSVSGGWCPWCQGAQQFCDKKKVTDCPPPSPCWGASGDSVDPAKFNQNKDLKDPDGNYWVDHSGTKPMWCPGKTYVLSWYNFADHNGIYRFESQLGNPGDEKEELFKNFTVWKSINNDPDTDYYDRDGVTKIPFGNCTTSTQAWAPEVAHCRDETWAKMNLTIPKSMPTGNTVIRLIWYGAMRTNVTRVIGPENSLFTNCLDVVVGDSLQCGE